jgi:hypothetical protein
VSRLSPVIVRYAVYARPHKSQWNLVVGKKEFHLVTKYDRRQYVPRVCVKAGEIADIRILENHKGIDT